jgi:hypothetical protein
LPPWWNRPTRGLTFGPARLRSNRENILNPAMIS